MTKEEIIRKIKEFTRKKIDNKYLVVNPKQFDLIQNILDEENIEIEMYSNDYCEPDKVLLIDKPLI